MATTRKRYSAEFKAKVALEAIRGIQTLSELGARFKVHPMQIAQWKRTAIEQMAAVFEKGRPRGSDGEAEKQALFEQIGRLKMELDWTEKKAGLLDSVASGPPGWVTLPPPGGLAAGCDWLPQGLQLAELQTGGASADAQPGQGGSAGALRFALFRTSNGGTADAGAGLAKISGLTLDVDSVTGLPVRAIYKAAGAQAAETDYANYISGGAFRYPQTVVKSVNGEKRIEIDYATAATHAGFADSDFVVPAPPATKRGAPQGGNR